MKKFFKQSSTRNQYFAAVIVNLIALSHGCAIGWLSPYIDYLRSKQTHLVTGPASSENLSWIGSLISVGGFFGVIIFGKISQHFGQKTSLVLLVIPQYIFWIMVLGSTDVHHLYIARMFAGVTGGGALRTISLYIAEISENHIRGKLGSFLVLFISTGTLIIFIAGTYLSFFKAPLIILIIPTLYFIGVFFLPDTPVSLLMRKKVDEARDSFLFYRSCSKSKNPDQIVNEEFELLKKTFESRDFEGIKLKDFNTKPAKKGLLIGLFLMFLNQFSGTLAIMTYTADIFKMSGSDFSSNESSTVVAFIQVIGVYVSTLCVEKFGRRLLMITSCTGSALFLTVLASFLYLKESGINVEKFNWVPVVSLSLIIFIASLGIISLPFVIMTELLPNKIRSFASSICLLGITSMAFMILKIFPPMIDIFQLYGCMWIFAGICITGAVITIISIPETKGKSLITTIESSHNYVESLLQKSKHNVELFPPEKHSTTSSSSS